MDFTGSGFFFVAIILYMLLFSCYWCQKKARLYNRTIREFEEQNRAARMGQNDQIYSVYTVERDRNMSAFYPPPYQEKDDLPTYDEALNHPQIQENTTRRPHPPHQNS